MKLSSQWIREFVDLPVDDRRLAEDLTAVGIAVEGISGSRTETVFEMEIGTNRPDAMNHYGVAREAAAIYDLPLKPLSDLRHQPSTTSASGVAFPISVEEPQLCPRFSARMIRGTRIKPSPEIIAHRLQLLDQRPISNAVDATNYVLWEMGKPTHAFDMDLLEGGQLIIRHAKNGEKLKTLDGVERTLSSEDLVVADAKRPVGLAGVMGGFETMITDKTKNILIESAWWDPLTVRKTARRHGIHTDASHRFERGADFESTVLSCDLVAELILASGGGELVGDVVDVVSKKIDQAPVILRLAEVHRILGGNLRTVEIFRILKKLGFGLIPEGQAGIEFDVHIPSWRLDVEREIDLIEEIARLHGYDKFENSLPAYSGAVMELPNSRADATLRQRALALGYNEAVSLSFISHEDAEKFSTASVLELENPLSAEASVMRTTMVPGMLDMLARNLNRDVEDVRLFEMGRVYEMQNGERAEPERLCLAATASAVKVGISLGSILDASQISSKSSPSELGAEEFRAFKGDVENLLTAFADDQLTFDRETPEYFHQGRAARALMDGVPVAQFGQVAEAIRNSRKLRQDVYLAEFDLEQLHARGLRKVVYKPLAKYPAVERDFSFIFPNEVEFGTLQRTVQTLRIAELRAFQPVEIFHGGSVEPGKYSILLRARLQSEEGTLRDEQVSVWSQKIVDELQKLGGVQRA
jgi:phenylalanyl-tRNA synthetase beta chain